MDVSLTFRQPAFFEEYVHLDASASYSLGLEEAYRLHEGAGKIAFSRTFLARITPYLAYSIAYQDLFDIQSGTQLGTIDLFENFVITYLEAGLAVDYRSDILDPRSGGYLSAMFRTSLPELGSAYSYIQASLDLRGYWPVASWLTLAGRAAWWHSVDLADSPPITEWFQGGGASDMRGYASQTMGPLACRDNVTGVLRIDAGATCADTETLWDYAGGTIKGLATIEARFFLPWDLGLVAFVDAGQAWSSVSEMSSLPLDFAVGPGLRYFTVIGPVRADLGVLVSRDPIEYAFHLSIGQAF